MFVKWNGKKWNRFILGHNRMGSKQTIETKRKISAIGKNRKHTLESRMKMKGNQNAKGNRFNRPIEWRKAVSKRMKGNQHTKGYKPSIETLIKLSGPNHWNWQGGISAEPYCDVWLDKEYKESIRKRDNYKCQNPSCWNNYNHLTLHIHHIDYNKKNCHPFNLISLCNSCNSRANHNRLFWEKLYQKEKVDAVTLSD